MTENGPDHSVRRPWVVLIGIGAAALASVPVIAGSAAPVDLAVLASAHDAAAVTMVVPSAPPTGDLLTTSPYGPTPIPLAGAVAAEAPVPAVSTTARPGTAAAAAIAFALAQRGLPYIWGGNGPQSGDAGFDCSGLTTAAYAYAGIALPRTAHTQFYAGPHVPGNARLEPGDLVFYGVPERVHHVGLYLGDGLMVNAPTFGKPVQIAYVRYPGDDFLGATRPAAGRDAPGLLSSLELPYVVPPLPLTPAPGTPPPPAEFLAPPVPDALVPPTLTPAPVDPALQSFGTAPLTATTPVTAPATEPLAPTVPPTTPVPPAPSTAPAPTPATPATSATSPPSAPPPLPPPPPSEAAPPPTEPATVTGSGTATEPAPDTTATTGDAAPAGTTSSGTTSSSTTAGTSTPASTEPTTTAVSTPAG